MLRTTYTPLSRRRPDRPGLVETRRKLMNPYFGDQPGTSKPRRVTIASLKEFFGEDPFESSGLFFALAAADRHEQAWNSNGQKANYQPDDRGGHQLLVRVGLIPSPAVLMDQLVVREPALRAVAGSIIRLIRPGPEEKTRQNQRCPLCTSNLYGVPLDNHSRLNCPLKSLSPQDQRQILWSTCLAGCGFCGSRARHHLKHLCNDRNTGRPCEKCGHTGHQSYHSLCHLDEEEAKEEVASIRERHFVRIQEAQAERKLLFWLPADFPEARYIARWPDAYAGFPAYDRDPMNERFPRPTYVLPAGTYPGILTTELPISDYPPHLLFKTEEVAAEFKTLEAELRGANSWVQTQLATKHGWTGRPLHLTVHEAATYEQWIVTAWKARKRGLHLEDFETIKELEAKLLELAEAERPATRQPMIQPASKRLRDQIDPLESQRFSTQARREVPAVLVRQKNNPEDARHAPEAHQFIEHILNGSAAGETDLRAFLATCYQPRLSSLRPPTRTDHSNSLAQLINQQLPTEPRAILERTKTLQWCITSTHEWDSQMTINLVNIQEEMIAYATILTGLTKEIADKDPYGPYYLESEWSEFTASWESNNGGQPRAIPSLLLTLKNGSRMLEKILRRLQTVARNDPAPATLANPENELQPTYTDCHREGYRVFSAQVEAAFQDEPAKSTEVMTRPSIAALEIIAEAKIHTSENEYTVLLRISQAQRALTGSSELENVIGHPDEVDKMASICNQCNDVPGYFKLLQVAAQVVVEATRTSMRKPGTVLPAIKLGTCMDEITCAPIFAGSSMIIPSMRTFHQNRSTPWTQIYRVQWPAHMNRLGSATTLDPEHSLRRQNDADVEGAIKTEAHPNAPGDQPSASQDGQHSSQKARSISTASLERSSSSQTARSNSTTSLGRHSGGSDMDSDRDSDEDDPSQKTDPKESDSHASSFSRASHPEADAQSTSSTSDDDNGGETETVGRSATTTSSAPTTPSGESVEDLHK